MFKANLLSKEYQITNGYKYKIKWVNKFTNP